MTHKSSGRCVRGASMFIVFWLNYQVGLQSTDCFAPHPFLNIYVSNKPQKQHKHKQTKKHTKHDPPCKRGASMFIVFWLNYQVGLQSTDCFAPNPFLNIYVSNKPQKQHKHKQTKKNNKHDPPCKRGASMFIVFWLNYQVGLQSTDCFAPNPFLNIYVSNKPQKQHQHKQKNTPNMTPPPPPKKNPIK